VNCHLIWERALEVNTELSTGIKVLAKPKNGVGSQISKLEVVEMLDNPPTLVAIIYHVYVPVGGEIE